MLLKRWIPRLIGIALAAGLAAFLLITQPWAKHADPITFSTVSVGKGTIAAQVTANGTLSAVSTVQVGAQVSGRVVELHADWNDQVKKGQVVAKLDDVILKSQVDQAAANLALAAANVNKAEVALVDAERQNKRQVVLQQQALVATTTVEEAQVTYDTAKAALIAAKATRDQAVANLAQAKLNLSYATIYSPVDGTVLSRAVDVGQTVAASLQAPVLFTIAQDLTRMQIDTAVAEADVGRLVESMKATFAVDAYPGRQFVGKVRQIRNAPTTTQGVVTYDAVIDVDNTDHALRPGMTANVTFVLAQVADAVKIPNAALRFKPTREQMMAVFTQFGRGSGHRRQGEAGEAGGPGGFRGAGGGSGGAGKRDFGDKKPVWKLVDGRPKMVLVKPGLSDGSSTQLVEGELEPGDQLVTEIIGAPTGPTRKVGAF
ncbi:MAG TPA: efflux RND transporter periplasmic adaptor subunit [Kofleriaceae bacterium]|nr:efflux RND transporter periplasmic adaptor subunit [Kofleriaceae bacterium]